MKINFRKIQKILDKFGLVLVVSFSTDFDDYPDNFPFQLWIDKKSKFIQKEN